MITFKASVASMNKKNRLFLALAVLGAVIGVSCNTTSDYDLEPIDYSGVTLKGFSLKADKTVLNNLDSVFFSIDLNSAQVFNADSLPLGTDVSSLAVTLSYDACSEAKIYEPADEGESENAIDYLEDSDSKIDFSKGAVRLHLVSADGTNSRDYYLKVNVHKVKTDSLCWGEMALGVLPTSFSRPTAQKTVGYKNTAYCLSTDGSSYCMAVGADVYADRWSTQNVTFAEPVDVRTLTATPDCLYVLTTGGSLLKSADGLTWNATGCVWKSITGVYGDRLLGLKADGVKYCHTSYPGDGNEGVAESDFPVSGNSATVDFMSKWSESLQIMIMGGVKADGGLSGDTWAYDGSSWVKLSSGLPAAEGYAVVPYIISETDTVSWRVKESDVMLAFGGRTAKEVSKTVYMSRDYGVTWVKADQLLQLPEEMPAVYSADGVVIKKLIHLSDAKSACGRWRAVRVAELPVWNQASPRAVAPITEWECPYIYMFGGYDSRGALVAQVWRGVVNHLSFKPLQ